MDPNIIYHLALLRELPLRAADGAIVQLHQLADIVETPGESELHGEDMRQNIAVTARQQGRDLGSAMADIRKRISADSRIPPGGIEHGGLYYVEHLRAALTGGHARGVFPDDATARSPRPQAAAPAGMNLQG